MSYFILVVSVPLYKSEAIHILQCIPGCLSPPIFAGTVLPLKHYHCGLNIYFVEGVFFEHAMNRIKSMADKIAVIAPK